MPLAICIVVYLGWRLFRGGATKELLTGIISEVVKEVVGCDSNHNIAKRQAYGYFLNSVGGKREKFRSFDSINYQDLAD
jgi:hypothetical protein